MLCAYKIDFGKADSPPDTLCISIYSKTISKRNRRDYRTEFTNRRFVSIFIFVGEFPLVSLHFLHWIGVAICGGHWYSCCVQTLSTCIHNNNKSIE